MFYYRIFGLAVRSEISLPWASLEKPGAWDVAIVRARGSNPQPADVPGVSITWESKIRARYAYTGLGTLLIEAGREILIDPAPGADINQLCPFILNHGLGALLFQRGVLVLHGSAMAFHNQAVAFLAHSGEGKSTLAAAFLGRFPVVTDDILAVQTNGPIPQILPGVSAIRLCHQTAASLFSSFEPDSRPGFGDDKIVVSLQNKFYQQALPLKRLYVLEKGEQLTIESLEPSRAVVELIRYSYLLSPLRAGLNRANHFEQCAEVANRVPVRLLKRPLDLGTLNEVVQSVVDDLLS